MTFPRGTGPRKQTMGQIRKSGGFLCPCGAATAVIDSRWNAAGNVRRRRECVTCGKRQTTYEIELSEYHGFLKALSGLAVQAAAMIRKVGVSERDSP